MAEKYVSVSALREMLSIPPDGDCEKCKHHRWNGCYNDELVRACEAIDDAPEADVVEVVRCKDCKWWAKSTNSAQGQCIISNMLPTGEYYCGSGRKREKPDWSFCPNCGADMREVQTYEL